jgi:hypothetical protein
MGQADVGVFIGDLLFWGLTGFCSMRGMAATSAGNGGRPQTTATAKATTTADPSASLRDDKQKASKDSEIR